MKQSRYKKLLGLAIGEQSMMVAEVATGERLQIRNVSQFTYPDGITTAKPAELGKALGTYLNEKGFTARAAVVGIPIRWLVVKQKDVPAADSATLHQLLRLEAEDEFSTELKDLVYDFADDPTNAMEKSVLVTATPRRYIDACTEMCAAARIEAVSITPTSLALAQVTAGDKSDKRMLVLATGPLGSELTAQDMKTATAVRHLRSPVPAPPFVSEMRRMVSMLGSNAASRDVVLWDSAGADTETLARDLGLKLTVGELSSLGADTSVVSTNGDGRKYAPAVALALSAMSDRGLPIDFLHSRLAAPALRRIPNWAYAAGGAALVLIALFIGGEVSLHRKHAQLDKLQASLKDDAPRVAEATKFIDQVSTAEFYHGGTPRYMEVLTSVLSAIPDDGQTYATNVTLSDVKTNRSANSSTSKKIDPQKITGSMVGSTSDEEHVSRIKNSLSRLPGFPLVKDPKVTNTKRKEVTFEIVFEYLVPPVTKPAAK